ncbi:hypothetical protein CVT23_20155 [Minwuia thermotolerans]|uniref:PRC-barrel domain-containing protein n=2 Tax=Minwuia thermotolerans TaxID=2056226 RepID=A0A2M9FWE8_9PROT|nr:hypothetical protein CVT23_20155 [Minwuia thermotolerans]
MRNRMTAIAAALALGAGVTAAGAQPAGESHMELEGANVLSVGGEEIGEIEEAIIDGTGRVVGVVVEFGDFFDLDDREVLMTLDELDYSPDGFVTDITEAEAEALIEWDREIDDMDVVDVNGHEIGEIERALVDRSGQVSALVVEVGGFLGMGDREVIMSLEKLEYARGDYMTRLPKAEIENLPEWEG